MPSLSTRQATCVSTVGCPFKTHDVSILNARVDFFFLHSSCSTSSIPCIQFLAGRRRTTPCRIFRHSLFARRNDQEYQHSPCCSRGVRWQHGGRRRCRPERRQGGTRGKRYLHCSDGPAGLPCWSQTRCAGGDGCSSSGENHLLPAGLLLTSP